MDTSPVKHFLLTFLMPEKCYEEFFVRVYLHVPCLKFVMNRIVGLWILLDAFLAPLPQLVQMVRRRRAEGLSWVSVLLQLYALSCPVVYTVANNFPLLAWGERLFTLAQTAAILFLILHYRGDTLKGVLLLVAYGCVMFLLGTYVSAAVASGMESSSLAALIASKVFQAGTNYSNGHTGQLSTLSVLLSWAGSLGAVFVSLQDTDLVTTLSHTLSACLSCVLLAQSCCCRSSSAITKQKSE